MKTFKYLVVAVLLSLPVSEQEKIMVCKDIQNVFTDADNKRDGDQITKLQGPPGKKGVQGVQGPPGLPGIQGLPGVPGAVDYEKISEMIEKKIRQRSYCGVGAGYTGKISGSSITVSSEYSVNHAARLGRINTPGIPGVAASWSARTSTIGEWIQVDLGKKETVAGVMIQGRGDADQWVTSFHVVCGLTTSSMPRITDENGAVNVR